MRLVKMSIFSILCVLLITSAGFAQLSGTYFIDQNASGGSLLLSGAIIYNDSTATPGDDYTDVIVSYKDAGGTLTAIDGTPIVITSIQEVLGDVTS